MLHGGFSNLVGMLRRGERRCCRTRFLSILLGVYGGSGGDTVGLAFRPSIASLGVCACFQERERERQGERESPDNGRKETRGTKGGGRGLFLVLHASSL